MNLVYSAHEVGLNNLSLVSSRYFITGAESPADFDGQFYSLGSGLCRGDEWQDGDWPHDGGFLTVEECGDLCEDEFGCQGFDVSQFDARAKKFRCWMHGHKKIEVASSLDGTCYKMTHGDEFSAGPGLIKIGEFRTNYRVITK